MWVQNGGCCGNPIKICVTIMKYSDLRDWYDKVANWADRYFRGLKDRPVRPNLDPGEILQQIPTSPPQHPESMEAIFADFERIIPDGMTHWQHPRFFAYFNSNSAPVSMIADQLANTMGAICMLWQTSPAGTELEIAMMDWMRQALGLPQPFQGVIQDSATSSTLSAVLTMRETALNWEGNRIGLFGQLPLRIYTSNQTHSSVDKAIRLAGLGQANLVKVPTSDNLAMDPQALVECVNQDRKHGYLPCGVIGCIGGTSVGASDNLAEILKIAKTEKMYSHVDAAWAGSAMICPEYRSIWAGIDLADSVVINPHKWLGAGFDCSIQFLRQPEKQIRTLSMKSAYLETLEQTGITDYSDWCIPLGRRFRSLKIWFLLRAYGISGLQTMIRNHVQWTHDLVNLLKEIPFVEIVTEPNLSLFTFRVSGGDFDSIEVTRSVLESINREGKIYLTQTTHQNQFVIRFTIGQFETTWEQVKMAVDVIRCHVEKIVSQS
ncbi:MAG: pyridoxal-dependent decarboxylase [Planctomycetota bacterium]